MKRSVITSLALTLALVIGPVGPAVPDAIEAPPGAPPTATEVVGSGWKTFLACVGCGVAGLGIASTGPAGVLAASMVPGSAIGLATCAITCYNAATE